MVVKILSSAATFNGINYNTEKIEDNRGQLMKVSGFGPLQALQNLRPEDYINYLQMIASQNKGISQPQFHAMISAKGRSHSAEELTQIASNWLQLMGYEKQPYLVVFHKDTANNHVHVVSVRVDKQGKKITSAFEHNRAIQNLNKVVGLQEDLQAKGDLEKALAYKFSTKAQFMMLLESKGYQLVEKEDKLQLIKYGKVQSDILVSQVKEKMSPETDVVRAAQLTAIMDKYRRQYSAELFGVTTPLPGGFEKQTTAYNSALADFLLQKFGLQLLFHSKDGKPVYGYSIIDHSGKNVFKGSDIFPLKELLVPVPDASGKIAISEPAAPLIVLDKQASDYYGTLLKAAINNYTSIEEGLRQQGLSVLKQDGKTVIVDNALNIQMDAAELLSAEDLKKVSTKEVYNNINISISDDIDDEAIYGPNRRRKRKARTNTR